MNKDLLNFINRRQIQLAGPRYAPSIEPGAPNIQILPLITVVHALAYSHGLRADLALLESRIKELQNRHESAVKKLLGGSPSLVELLEAIQGLGKADPRSASPFLRDILNISRCLSKRLSREHSRLIELQRESKDREASNRIEGNLYDVRSLSGPISDVVEFSESPSFPLLSHNALLLLGHWGTGKTHFLCDVTNQRMAAGLPTLFYLASNIPDDSAANPIDSLCLATGLASSTDELLSNLQRLGEQHGERALLIIDALNEGNRHKWRKSLGRLLEAVRHHTNVGLIVSCRSAFESLVLTSRTRRALVHFQHVGFRDVEFDAQLEFFSYYGIDAPAFPLIAPEFSRPLFLKLLCQALRNLTTGAKQRRFKEIASGQKGMTYILEHFVKEVGNGIEKDFGLPKRSCWFLLKGTDQPGQDTSIAGAMAKRQSDEILRSDCLSIIRKNWQLPARAADRFLRRLLADGLVAEGVRWEPTTKTTYEVIQFPYQRFGDHLIARHLLAAHLNTTSEQSIRRSFYSNRPLGKIFLLDNYGQSFLMPGIASAIMLEFPERIRRTGLTDREIVRYLPARSKFVAPLKDTFLEGLHWRPADSITASTDKVVDFFVNHDNTRKDAYRVLVVLAARPGHPYAASRLAQHLIQMPMAERDLKWTEFLREERITWERLILWVERNASRISEPLVCKNTIRLLSLFLTTVNRPARDRVTYAILLAGIGHPAVLFEETEWALDFNDPYVPERMLAASYGVAMNLWADPAGRNLREAIYPFAQNLIAKMFAPGAPHATSHTLMRDYALGIIEIARKVHPGRVARAQRQFLVPPFSHLPSSFRRPGAISDEEVEKARHGIRMDFGNYTIGSLIPDRANYEDGHPEYKDVLRQIHGRMIDLGYSPTHFDPIDRFISRDSASRHREPGQTDRYGKKYAWIAFFEMYGARDAAGLLRDYQQGERTSDCDIDPSFPVSPPQWHPPFPALFTQPYDGLLTWLQKGPDPDYRYLLEVEDIDGIEGPWVLLDGYISQTAANDPRKVFTLLRGLLLKDRSIPTLSRLISETPFPSHQRIPEPRTDYYTFAGEVPWSRRFGGRHLRTRGGRAKPHLDGVYERFVNERWVREIIAEVPVHDFGWESYHSVINKATRPTYPAPLLCEVLDLVKHSRTLDLFDRLGRVAAIYREAGTPDGPDGAHFTYLRRDLLNQYLAHRGRQLVWIPWGERTFDPRHFQGNVQLEVDPAWHVHKTFLAYQR